MYLSPSELTHAVYLVCFSGLLTSEHGPVLLESLQGHIPLPPAWGKEIPLAKVVSRLVAKKIPGITKPPLGERQGRSLE